MKNQRIPTDTHQELHQLGHLMQATGFLPSGVGLMLLFVGIAASEPNPLLTIGAWVTGISILCVAMGSFLTHHFKLDCSEYCQF